MFQNIYEKLEECVILACYQDPKTGVYYFLKTKDLYPSFSFEVRPRVVLVDQVSDQFHKILGQPVKFLLHQDFREELKDPKTSMIRGFYLAVVDDLSAEKRNKEWITFRVLLSSLAADKNRTIYLKVLQILSDSHKQTIKVIEE